MTKRMLIDAAHTDETRVALLDNDLVYDYDFVSSAKSQIKGNIYLAKITRVEPSLQAAFVEYGGGKQGFLPFSEIHPDYYQLPADDKAKLLAEQIAEAEAEEAAEDEAFEREQAMREARGGRSYSDSDGETESDTEAEDDVFASEEDIREETIERGEANVALAEASSADSAVLASLPDIAPVEIPANFANDVVPAYEVQPLTAESFAVHSDVMPEDFVETTEHNTEATVAEEGAEPSETTSEDAEETRGRGGNRGGRIAFHRRYRIQEVIKRNQIVLVQVIKEERGNKGASLTTFISLAGRAAVLMPNSPKGGGISRKITDRETRRRLKEVASEMRTHRGMSVIIRTAGIDRTKAEIRRDYEYLVKLWNDVREQTLASTAPALIYEEGNLIKRSLRDLYTSDVEEVIVEGEAAYNEAKGFMKILMPSHAARIKLYKETTPLFSFAGVEEQLSGMTEPQVRLPSGGYLVINPTEALISIDVNSGRSTSERNVEETAIKTNLEAAAEVARQLRLRDLAGLIVIDFIDMNYGKNRKAVERAMKDALKADRAKIQIGRISTFGLMEMSRQRLRPSISESMGLMCPHCRGTGYIHSVETIAIQIIRTLEKEAASGDYTTLRITTHPEAALFLLNEKRAQLQSIEQRSNVSVSILMDAALITGSYRLIKVTNDGKEILHEDAKASQGKRDAGRQRRGRRGGRDKDGKSLNFSDATTFEADSGEELDSTYEARPDDDEIIGGGAPKEAREPREPRTPREPRGDRPDRPRRERGGRNRRPRGDRPERGPRPDMTNRTPEEIAAIAAQGEGVAPSTEPELNADGTPRERSRRRGRRGGRNRRPDRERGERGPRPEGAGEQQQAAMSPAPEQPIATTYTPRPSNDSAPRAPRPTPMLSEKQTNPDAIASPIRSDGEGAKEKRKGWWSRVLES